MFVIDEIKSIAKLLRNEKVNKIIIPFNIDAWMYPDPIGANVCRAWRKRVRLGDRVEVP